MRQYRSLKNNLYHIITILCLGILLCTISGCGGGSSSGGSADTGETGEPNSGIGTETDPTLWTKVTIKEIDAGGMLSPHVKASSGAGGLVHIAYFTDSVNVSGDYTINHVLWDTTSSTELSHTEVLDVDNCRTLDLALSGSMPVVAYQGGQVRAGGSEQQSDAMISILNSGTWTEYTGGIGFVERNPVFEDGLAGKYVTVAADSGGDIHLCYQFFYEGIDAMNFNYPDLLYVEKASSALGFDSTEEQVEGNLYNSNGTASEQNTVGAHTAIMIDAGGSPVVFYYADLNPNSSDYSQKGLRMARNSGGTWVSQWVETGFSVGAISCGLSGSGNISVAYYVQSEYEDTLGTHTHCLKYATYASSAWAITLVDESTLCGDYCSLAFDSDGMPAIAYYSLQNHSGSLTLKDLKYAGYNGSSWDKEVISSTGDIGYHNNIFFDGTTTYICSYSNTDSTIYLFYR